MDDLAKRISDARNAKGLTNEDLARAVGVGLRTVQRWQDDPTESGKVSRPRARHLTKLAETLDVPRWQLLASEEDLESFQSLHAQLRAEVDRLRDLNDEIQARLTG